MDHEKPKAVSNFQCKFNYLRVSILIFQAAEMTNSKPQKPASAATDDEDMDPTVCCDPFIYLLETSEIK